MKGKIYFSHQISILLVLLIPKRYNTWVSGLLETPAPENPLKEIRGFSGTGGSKKSDTQVLYLFGIRMTSKLISEEKKLCFLRNKILVFANFTI